jgi:hypothetical protein
VVGNREKMFLVSLLFVVLRASCMDGFVYRCDEHVGVSNHLYREGESGAISTLEE